VRGAHLARHQEGFVRGRRGAQAGRRGQGVAVDDEGGGGAEVGFLYKLNPVDP
jgi:hypothetical protein